MNEETRIEGQEFLADEYMKVVDYTLPTNRAVVKQADEAEMASFAMKLTDKKNFETVASIEALRVKANSALSAAQIADNKAEAAQTTADEATGKANEAMVGLAGKVDTIDGKGLSANDYTTAEKAKLAEMRAEPAGCIKLFAGNILPEGYLWCDGGSYAVTGPYARLYDVIGTTYNKPGAAEGSFNVPDMRGRVGVGKNGKTFDVLGNIGGEEAHKLTIAEMPKHTVEQDAHGHPAGSAEYASNETGADWAGAKGVSKARAVGTSRTIATNKPIGGDMPHNNLQPYLVCNYIIKY